MQSCLCMHARQALGVCVCVCMNKLFVDMRSTLSVADIGIAKFRYELPEMFLRNSNGGITQEIGRFPYKVSSQTGGDQPAIGACRERTPLRRAPAQ